MDPLDWIDDELSALDANHLLRRTVTRFGPQRDTISLTGPQVQSDQCDRSKPQSDSSAIINFSANDYLGLAADERLIRAAMQAAHRDGWGAGASPLVTGRSTCHAELERRLAQFERTESALVFTSGFAANLGTVAALVEKQDAIYADAKNHASLIDGCRLSRADIHIYRHGDVDHLAELLRDSSRYRRRLIVTDSLFSMDGDLAPLEQIAQLAAKHAAMLMVDDAHATGVFGSSGRGVAEYLGVEDGIHIRMGTLSKALGSAGGFVVGRRSLIEWLANRSRSYVFSTALPPAVAGAAIAALEIVRDEPERRINLLNRAGRMRRELAAQGWNLGRSASQIIPVYIGDAARTMQLSHTLCEQGFYVPGIRPPSVPEGESLLRISLSCAHSDAAIDQLLAALANCRSSQSAV